MVWILRKSLCAAMEKTEITENLQFIGFVIKFKKNWK